MKMILFTHRAKIDLQQMHFMGAIHVHSLHAYTCNQNAKLLGSFFNFKYLVFWKEY